MKKTFAVIGLGRFGLGVLRELNELHSDVIALDINEESVNKAILINNHSVICDATKKNVLKELGINNVDHAVVAIGNNLQATILTTINLHELGVKNITVRVDSEEYIPIMERLGATDTVVPEDEAAIGLANKIMSDYFVDYYKISNGYGIVQLEVGESFEEKSLLELKIRDRYDINIVGIIRDEKFFIPKGSDTLKPADIVLVVGTKSVISKFSKFIC